MALLTEKEALDHLDEYARALLKESGFDTGVRIVAEHIRFVVRNTK